MIRLSKSQIYKVLNKNSAEIQEVVKSTNKTNMSWICYNSVDIYIFGIYILIVLLYVNE